MLRDKSITITRAVHTSRIINSFILAMTSSPASTAQTVIKARLMTKTEGGVLGIKEVTRNSLNSRKTMAVTRKNDQT